MCLQDLFFWSDSKLVVNNLLFPKSDSSYLVHADDTWSICNSLRSSSFTWIPRSANVVTQRLAYFVDYEAWVDEIPRCISDAFDLKLNKMLLFS